MTVKERGLPVIGEYWSGLSFETKATFAVLAGPLIIAAGFFAATGVSGPASPGPGTGADAAGETMTVDGVVTLTDSGERTVVRTVRVVTRVTEPSVLGTAVESLTVTTPGPRDLITVPGQPRTIVETRGGRTRTSVVTNERVVTDRRVVTNDRVVTDRRVVTNERVVTNDRTITDVQTQQVTVPITTIRTVTDTFPVTQTFTTTQVLTETVVPPPATVTVTVTCPPRGCE